MDILEKEVEYLNFGNINRIPKLKKKNKTASLNALYNRMAIKRGVSLGEREDRLIEIIQHEPWIKEDRRKLKSASETLGQYQRSSVCCSRSSDERRKSGVQKKRFEEIITENFPNLGEDMNFKIHHSQ